MRGSVRSPRTRLYGRPEKMLTRKKEVNGPPVVLVRAELPRETQLQCFLKRTLTSNPDVHSMVFWEPTAKAIRASSQTYAYIVIDVGWPKVQLLAYSGNISSSEFARALCVLVEGGPTTLPAAVGVCFSWSGLEHVLEEAMGTIGYTCEGCRAVSARMRVCGSCRFARYCSEACQHNCWRTQNTRENGYTSPS